MFPLATVPSPGGRSSLKAPVRLKCDTEKQFPCDKQTKQRIIQHFLLFPQSGRVLFVKKEEHGRPEILKMVRRGAAPVSVSKRVAGATDPSNSLWGQFVLNNEKVINE